MNELCSSVVNIMYLLAEGELPGGQGHNVTVTIPSKDQRWECNVTVAS